MDSNPFRTLCAAVIALWLPAVALGHGGGSGGPATGSLSFADPAPLGIGYEWTVQMHRRETMQMVHAVGAKSWQEPSNPDGAKGWTHTSNWVAFELVEPATVKITVERQQGVVVVGETGVASAARDALVPAVSVYRGWDETTETEAHTFNNVGNFWSTIEYLGTASNPKAKSRVLYKAKLPAGRYSIVIGGNPKSLGDPGAYPAGTCDPADAVCYQYTGMQGYRATIQTK
jgi:hypothetical protein